MTPNREPKPTWQFLLLFCLKPGGRNLTHVYCLHGGKIEYLLVARFSNALKFHY